VWTFFAEATNVSVRILVGSADLLRKIAFPSITLPLSSTFTAGLVFVFNLLAVLVFVLFAGIEPTWSWLWAPLLLAELAVVTIGVSLLLSAAFVNVRDIGQIWEVGVQALFYATPIIYPLQMVPESYQEILLANPIAQIVQCLRWAVIDQSQPLGPLDSVFLLVPVGIAVSTLVAGLVCYRMTAPKMVERL
jgi:ABC-2 type transport system permease protein